MKFTTITDHLFIENKDFAIIRIDLDLNDEYDAYVSKNNGNGTTYYGTLDWNDVDSEGRFESSKVVLFMKHSVEEAIEAKRYELEVEATGLFGFDVDVSAMTQEQKEHRKSVHFALLAKHEAKLAEIRNAKRK